MASPFAYKPYAPPTFGAGQHTQNALYQMMSANAAQSTPPFNPPPTTNFGGDKTEPASAQTVYPRTPGPAILGGQINVGNGNNPSGDSDSSDSSSSSSNGFGDYSFDGDPILARIRALGRQQVADAEASALGARKTSLIGYGYDPALQKLYPDNSTAEAARQNPFSTLAQLLYGHNQRDHSLTEALNKANLFYSGERINQTGNEGREYTLEQSQAGTALRSALAQIAQQVLQAKMQAQQNEIQGESDAYSRAIQFALANGTGMPGGGGAGATSGNSSDWLYGSTLPAGLSGEQALAAAKASAPSYGGDKFVPVHIMNQGMVFTDSNGHKYITVKYVDPTGKQPPSTEPVYIP